MLLHPIQLAHLVILENLHIRLVRKMTTIVTLVAK
jgi:hypothetical protein